jgi:hypothetical protein
VHQDDEAGAKGADRRNNQPAMTAQPMHGVILGAALLWANAKILNRNRNRNRARAPARARLRETSCDSDCPRYFSGPRTLMRRVDLLTWSRKAEPNQRMRSRRSLTKEQFAERGVPHLRDKQNAKSH